MSVVKYSLVGSVFRTINSNVASFDCPHHSSVVGTPLVLSPLLAWHHKNSMLHYFIMNLHAEYIFMKA